MKLGILDWGIGGVNLLRKIRKHSSIDVIYFSDTGFAPYGKVPEDELQKRVQKVISYLRLCECEYIAVACNAASTVIPDDPTVSGVIQPAIEMVREMNLPSLGIAGGKRTIDSEIYKNVLEKSGIRVKQQIAQPLSARIEAGDLHSPELKKEIAEIFSSLKNEKYILLACTHYPVISKQINEYLPNAVLLDPMDKMTEKIIPEIKHLSGSNTVKWMTSGNIHEMSKVLQAVYQINAFTIERNLL